MARVFSMDDLDANGLLAFFATAAETDDSDDIRVRRGGVVPCVDEGVWESALVCSPVRDFDRLRRGFEDFVKLSILS